MASLFSISIVLSLFLVNTAGRILNTVVDEIYTEVLANPALHGGAILSQSIVMPSMIFVQISGVLLAISFLFVGICLAIAFRITSKNFGKIYTFDLFGAGIGCILTVIFLSYFQITTAILSLSLLSATGALMFTKASIKNFQKNRFYLYGLNFFLLGFLLANLSGYSIYDFKIHKYAFLRSFYHTPLKELKYQWTPLGRVTLAQREWSPPLNSQPKLRPLTFVGMDLGGFSVIEKFTPENLKIIKNTSVFSDDIPEPIVVPGLYANLKEYLVLMAGNGQDMLRAYACYGENINLTGVELNPAVFQMGLEYKEANLEVFFNKPNVKMEIAEGRSFIEHSQKKYDLICLSYSGATFATGNGTLSSTPQFLFTKEAFKSYLKKLTDRGVLIVVQSSLPTDLPPSLRTFCAALKEIEPETDLRKHVLAYSRPGFYQNRNYTIYHRKPLTKEMVRQIEKIFSEHNLTITYSAYTASKYPAMQSFFDVLSTLPGSLYRGFPYPASSQERVHSDNHPFYYFDLIWGRAGGFLVIGYTITFLSALGIAMIFLAMPLIIKRGKYSTEQLP
ncbi:MAG: hypothetical protein D6707_05650, partial [Bacteroidetes bacterium]